MKLNKKSANNRSSERGAVAIEFALVGLLLFSFVGVIFDLGLGWFRWSNLTCTTAEAARTAAQSMFRSRGESCSAIETRVAASATTLYNQRYHFGAPTFTSVVLPTGGPRVVRVSGAVPLDCIFCNLLPSTITMRAQAESMIEHGGFSCTR